MRGSRRTVRRVAALVVLALALAGCADIVTLEPPEIGAQQRQVPTQSFVYDADGNQLAVLRRQFRERVPLDRIPAVLQDAVVVAEDQRFWVHGGVDARAIVRAALRNAAEGEVEQGGSTITQQLVKNLWMPDAPRDLTTKAKEALLARDLEEERSKREILEEYLNTVYFGNGAYGVQAAAFTYWRKDVSELTLPEAALLAGIIRAPEALDPATAPDAARARRDRVLDAMVEHGKIGREDAAAAEATPLEVQPRPEDPAVVQPYWVQYVVRTLLDEPAFGEDVEQRRDRIYGGGLRIHTTLDPRAQAAAEAAARRFFPDPSDPEVAIVSVDPATGAVVAAVGGRDFETRNFDLATQGRRQPGSTFKTFVLTAAIAAGYRPETIVDGDQGVLRISDGPSDLDRWRVRNYDRRSYGAITLAEATRASVNGAYARVALDIGIGRVINAARALGVTSPLNDDPAIALGGVEVGVSPLEMAAAYATLANLGTRVPVSPIDRVEDAEGNVIWRPDRTPRPVVDAGVAWIVTQMLRQVVEDGTGIHARLAGWQVAGKTGTTSSYTDAWFVGYTPVLSTAVWMGYPDDPSRHPLRGIRGERVVTGGTWPARIWRVFMADALAGRPPQGFMLPEHELVTVEIDPASGLLAAPWCPGELRTVLRLLAPRETCPSPPPAPPPPSVAPSDPVPTPSPSAEPSAASASPTSPSPSPSATGSEPSPSPSPTGSGASPSPSSSPSATSTSG